jgi:hypothetical protein
LISKQRFICVLNQSISYPGKNVSEYPISGKWIQ